MSSKPGSVGSNGGRTRTAAQRYEVSYTSWSLLSWGSTASNFRIAEELLSEYIPTLTAVRPSSSDALLPPPALLFVLMRLLLLGEGLTMALMGRGGIMPGDVGGELAMAAVVV